MRTASIARVASATLLSLLVLLGGCAASHSIPEDARNVAAVSVLHVRGTIGDESLAALNAALGSALTIRSREPGGSELVVELDSDGGDIDVALAMGRLLRRAEATASVPRDARCASACVLLLAGAVQRTVAGPVQIHRPYRVEPRALGYAAAQTVFRDRNRRIAKFLDEMNVSSRLLDAMLAVPPEAARNLSASELADFGLDRNDPVYEEERDAARAKALGLPMAQYLARKRIEAEDRDGSDPASN